MSEAAPAFSFYAKDFLVGTATLSLAERGAYITLLAYQWDVGSVPDDATARWRILGGTRRDADAVWSAIGGKFVQEADGHWRNARLELERGKQRAYRELQSRKGQASARTRWGHASNRGITEPVTEPVTTVTFGLQPNGNSSSSSSSSSPDPEKSKKDQKQDQGHAPTVYGAELPKATASALTASPPGLLTFPTVGPNGQAWALTAAQVAEWEGLFPGLDVLEEARHALAWVEASPERRKTGSGMKRFLVGWLTRTTNRSPGRAGLTGHPRTAGNREALQRFAARRGDPQ